MRSRGQGRGHARQRGQALAELALTSVFLIAITFGAVDFARVYNADTALQEAARVAVRHAAIFDPSGKVNPFLCDTTLANTCPSPSTTLLSTDGIKQVVDRVLAGANLPASTLVTGSGTCVGGTSPYNGPFTTQFNSDIGTNYNHPYLYICYNTTTGTPTTRSGPPTCPALPAGCGNYDMEVVVLMKLSLVITGQVGPALNIVGNAHMWVQGT